MVSVIVPIYNIEDYLDKCVTSILSQTYRDIEVILVNDGSTDSSGKICQKYRDRDSRVILLDKENGGLSDARNTGICHAHGEYIMLVDGDDYIHRQTIEIMLKTAEHYDADLVVCDYEKVYQEPSPIENAVISFEREAGNVILETGSAALGHLFEGFRNRIKYTITSNKLYRKELFDSIKYPIGKIHEDEFVAYKLLAESKNVAFLDIKLYFYVQRAGSIMAEAFSEKRYDRVCAYRERADYCIAEKLYADRASMAYLREFSAYIDDYQEYIHNDRDGIRELKEEFHKSCKHYRRYVPVVRYLYFLVKRKYKVIMKNLIMGEGQSQ